MDIIQRSVANATAEMDPLKTTMFALGILATVPSAYILWMYKRIFFGKIPEVAHVKDSNRYHCYDGSICCMTLIIGVYPDLFLNPTMDYYENVMFQGQEGVILPAPSQETTTTDTRQGLSHPTIQDKVQEERRLRERRALGEKE